MLREIRCKKFRCGSVKFHSGLNVILGDENATNSIGKSTILMVIDFVFGGDTLLKHNRDIVAELGHLEYEFAFLFDGQPHFFRRDTVTPEVVYVCNASYEVESLKPIDEFTALLKSAYRLPARDQTFRAAVGLHLRVWGKDNLLVDRPLHTVPAQSARDCIENLIKTFDLYDGIREKEAASRRSDAALKALRSASEHELVPKVSKQEYIAANSRIVALERDLDDIRRSLESYDTRISEVVDRDVLALKVRRDELLARRQIVSGKLIRLDRNLQRKRALKSKNFRDLLHFFPQVNVRRLEEVEAFHDGVARHMKAQLEQSKDLLAQELELINAEVVEIETQIGAKLQSIDKPAAVVDHVYEVALSLQEARGSKFGFEMHKEFREAAKRDRDALGEEKDQILKVIETTVNEGMRRIVNSFAGEHRKSPRLTLGMSKYSFEVYEDTGTGTAYFGLALFDLAVFRATTLPVVAHDSILFKNIENDSVAKLIEVYVQCEKQSFIALDEIEKYGDIAAGTLQERCVLKLSDSAVLFVKDWRRRGSGV